MPCSPVTPPVFPPPPPFPSPFGPPFAPSGIGLGPLTFPEDILDLLKYLTLPTLPVIGALDPNFAKDIFDVIMKLLEALWPFLALYKMLLIVMNLILCIIEVICSLLNPFALIGAVINLFTNCLPPFLNLFPIFALIVLILSLIFLIILLIEYIIAKIIQLILIILANIEALVSAFALSDEIGIIAILAKLGAVLCGFQNLLVILILFDAFFSIIRAILALVFPIPPCSDASDCCQPQLCSAWVKNNTNIKGATGTLIYTQGVNFDGSASLSPALPGFNLIQAERVESWQFYDPFATIFTQMQNINSAYDLPDGYSPTVIFPTTQTFTATTPPMQAPYTVDLTLLYNPTQWNRIDSRGPREIKIMGCIVLTAPDGYYLDYDNNEVFEPTGVAELAGGLTFEIDGTTPIKVDGYQGTLNTLLHIKPDVVISSIPLPPTGVTTFTPISYSFNINHPILLANALITLGCIPSVATAKTFVNTTYGNTANIPRVNALLNGPTFPCPACAQNCIQAAIDALRADISTDGVATFQATTTACLNDLQANAIASAETLLDIGFDPYTSTFTLTPDVQFTTLTIDVRVSLMDTNGQLLTTGMPTSMGPTIAANIHPTTSFGTISPFTYDGYQFFNAQISSSKSGSGTIEIAYNSQIISTINVGVPSITPTVTPYEFIYAPLPVKTGVGDTDGQLRPGGNVAGTSGLRGRMLGLDAAHAVSGGGVTPSLPRTHMTLWLKAGTYTVSGGLGTWPDSSGNGYDATTSNPGYEAFGATPIISSLNGITSPGWNGGQLQSLSSSGTIAQILGTTGENWSAFCVFAYTGSSPFEAGLNGVANTPVMFMHNTDGANQWGVGAGLYVSQLVVGGSNWQSSGGQNFTTTDTVSGSPNAIHCVSYLQDYAGGTTYLAIDGGVPVTTTALPVNTLLAATLEVGFSAQSLQWQGPIGELIVYDAYLSGDELAAVQAYLLATWGLT
jgi:hypothetical protein